MLNRNLVILKFLIIDRNINEVKYFAMTSCSQYARNYNLTTPFENVKSKEIATIAEIIKLGVLASE